MRLDRETATKPTHLADFQLQEERVDEAELALSALGQHSALALRCLTLSAAAWWNQVNRSVL